MTVEFDFSTLKDAGFYNIRFKKSANHIQAFCCNGCKVRIFASTECDISGTISRKCLIALGKFMEKMPK